MIYYANAGFYQFLKNMTSEKRNSTEHTITGTSIVMSRGAKYLVESDIKKNNLYFKFDICQETDYEKAFKKDSEVASNTRSFPVLTVTL